MKRIITILVATITAATALLIGPAGGPAAAATTGPWVIQPWTSYLCLAPEGFASATQTVVDQHLCERGTNRDWNFTNTVGGYYEIAYRNGLKCMAVKGASSAERAPIITQGCGDYRWNDQWAPIPNPNFNKDGLDYYLLQNRATSKCLAVKGNSVLNGADMMQYTCDDFAPNQAFTWNRP
jgi:hypothetical protein